MTERGGGNPLPAGRFGGKCKGGTAGRGTVSGGKMSWKEDRRRGNSRRSAAMKEKNGCQGGTPCAQEDHGDKNQRSPSTQVG